MRLSRSQDRNGCLSGGRFLLALTLLAVMAGGVQAITIDARKMAMSGASPPRSDRMSMSNPAYSVVPERYPDRGTCIPIPLGLFVFLADMPETDPDSYDYDALELMNVIANPPWHLDLTEPNPLDGDVTIDLSKQNLRIYWEDAHLLIPEEPLDIGGRFERFGLGLGRPAGESWRWHFKVTPFFDGSAEVALDDALYGVLAEGDFLEANSTYGMTAEGKATAGLSWRLLYAGRIKPDLDTEVYVGVGPKLISGFGMAKTDMDFSATTGATNFASETLEMDFINYTRTTDGFTPGYGLALDLGLALRRGPWDLGVGVRDLAGSIKYSKTTLERQYLEDTEGDDEGNSEVITETLEEGVEHRYILRPYWLLNAAYTATDWLVSGEMKLRPQGNSLHLGSEYYLGAWALRAGIQHDSEDHWQMSGGFGYRFRKFEINLALETHNRFVQDEKGTAMGLSVNI